MVGIMPYLTYDTKDVSGTFYILIEWHILIMEGVSYRNRKGNVIPAALVMYWPAMPNRIKILNVYEQSL